MGLFSTKKIELRNDIFTAHFDKSWVSLSIIREQRGFKVTSKREYCCDVLNARMEVAGDEGVLIWNNFYDVGRKECHLVFYGSDQTYVQEFVNRNFRKEFNYFVLPNGDKMIESSMWDLPPDHLYYIIFNEDNPKR